MKSFLSNEWFPPLLFFLIGGILTASWFRSGLVYGGGDVGLQTYDPQRMVQISRYIWWEATAPGSPTPQGLTALPFNFIFSLLQFVGFTPVALQASLFFLILAFMGWGMYLLILFLFGESFKKYAFFGGLFYLFNPYMMISVWHRFVHSTFFLAAALPFLIIFWLKWIRNKKVTSLLGFLIINLLAVYSFGTIAYILTLWLLLFLITLSEVIFPWVSFRNAKKVTFLTLLGLLFWFLTNYWWLTPVFKVAPSFLSEQHTSEQILSTLYNLGYQTVLPYSLQMINPYYLFDQLDFGANYQQTFWRMIPWFFAAVILVGFLRGLLNIKTAKWSVIYLMVLVLSKGIASPMGYFYDFGMRYFFPLGVLRNPYEKIGILLPLLSSILLTVGLKIIFDFLKTKINQVAFFSMLTALVLLFSWPMFKGRIFGKIDNPAFVEVPSSYNEADLWIKSVISKNFSHNSGKILHLPLTSGEGISYNWQHGYSGLEPSALLFSAAPSISHGFNIKQIDSALSSLDQMFQAVPFITPDTILRLLQDFNIRFIVLHKDVKWEEQDFYNPQQTEKLLNKLTFLDTPQKFGDLVVYQILDNYFKGRINLTDSFDWIDGPKVASLWPWILSENRTLVTDLKKKGANNLIFPKVSFRSYEATASAIALLYDDLWLEPLLKLKETYRRNNEIEGEETNDKLISSCRRLLKIFKVTLANQKKFSAANLQDYTHEMRQVFSSNSKVLDFYAREKNISDIFQSHLYMLRKIASKLYPNGAEVIKIGDELKENLIKKNFISSYYSEGLPSPLSEKQVLKFDIPKASNYELLLATVNKGDQEKKLKILIDGRVENLNTQTVGNIVSVGEIFLTAGSHEIDLPLFSLDKDVILRKLNPNQKNTIAGSVAMEQKSPSLYTGNFQIKSSALLTFSESYHPNWKLRLIKDGKEVTPASHLLANLYANAWYISEAGEYQFRLEFEPQRIVNFGLGLAATTYAVLVLYSIIFRMRKK